MLGGVPSVEVESPETSSMCEDMLKQDLEGEQTAIDRYKQRIGEARAFGLTEAEPTLLDILEDEVSHKNDLCSILEE